MDNTKNREKGEVKVDVRKRVVRGGALALIVIAAILTVLSALSGWLFMTFIGYTLSDSRSKTEYIRTGDEFIEKMNSRIVSHEYRLLDDIELDAATWNKTMDHIVLRGMLNGNGHKVIVSGSLQIPLFSRIETSAEVSHISFENTASENGGQTSAALLAYVNYGTVSDCTFFHVNATVGSEQYLSFVAAHNFGTIENCVVDGKFFAGSGTLGRVAGGALAAINYKNGAIKNCIVSVTYVRGFDAIENPYFNESEVNDKLGYAVGQNSGTLGAVYCIAAEHFNYASDGKSETEVKNIGMTDLTVKFLSSLGFATDYWEIAAGNLPKLKIMMG